MASLILFIRSLLFNIWFFGMTFVFGSYGILLRLFWREKSLGLAQRWAATVLFGAKHIAGIEAVVTGQAYLPKAGPALIASQHQSAFDTLVWLTMVPKCSYVLKQELTRIPLFGPLLRPAGQIVVDRGAGAQALRSLLREGKHAAETDRQIVIFPEGTRTVYGADLPLHPGVIALSSHLKLPVVPVATDSGLRWGRAAFFKRPGPVHLHIMPPIQPGIAKSELVDAIKKSWRDATLSD